MAAVANRPQFRTSSGRLTYYSFACGYVEIKSTNPDSEEALETTIWMEHAHFHVRQHDHRPESWGRVFWEVFDTLHEARDYFGRAKGRLKTKRVKEPTE